MILSHSRNLILVSWLSAGYVSRNMFACLFEANSKLFKKNSILKFVIDIICGFSRSSILLFYLEVKPQTFQCILKVMNI